MELYKKDNMIPENQYNQYNTNHLAFNLQSLSSKFNIQQKTAHISYPNNDISEISTSNTESHNKTNHIYKFAYPQPKLLDESIESTSNCNNNNISAMDKIKKIKKMIYMKAKFKLGKLTSSKETLNHFLQFFNGKDLTALYFTCKIFNHTILDLLKVESSQYILQSFQRKYQTFLTIIRSKLIIAIDKDTKELSAKIYIEIQLSLPLQYINKTIQFENYSSWSSNKNELYRNVYKFDYNKKSSSTMFSSNKNEIPYYWIFQDYRSFSYNNLNQACIMPILPFKINDIGIITINTLSSIGFLNFRSFQWKDIKICSTKKIEYDLSKSMKKRFDFDYSRLCEIEFEKTQWENIGQSTPSYIHNEIKKFKSIFKSNFTIINVQWCSVGYSFIKFKTNAICAGEVNNNYFGVDMKIVKQDDIIYNEIKKNGLVYDYINKLQVRIGEVIIFYLGINESI